MDMQDTPVKFLKRNLKLDRIKNLISRGFQSIKNDGMEATWRKVQFRLYLMLKLDVWQFRCDIPLQKELKQQRDTQFAYMPKISIVVPLYNTPKKFLTEMVKSVRTQSYQNWELVLVNAAGSYPDLENDTKLNPQIKLIALAENKGIAENTNVGFAHCTGDYIALLDHDDVLLPNALFENVKAINETKADVLYSDEVTLDGSLRHLIQFHFKPDYAPDFLRGVNYITHLLVFQKDLFHQIGAYEDKTYDGAQDYDLILRLTEQAKCIHHIPKVLYYWRGHQNSTAKDMSTKMYAFEAGKKAIEAHLKRMDLSATVEIQQWPGSYRVRYDIIGNPKVSVIIPNKDHIEDLSRCLSSLTQKAGWTNFEIIVVENNSENPETFAFYEKAIKEYTNVHLVYYTGAFNFAAICNFGAQFATGEHILLLNNDVECLTEDFIKEMLMYSQRADVGAVGAKLYYPDDTIQHGGVIIGINGSAGHSHKGLEKDTTGNLYRLVTPQNYMAVTGACLMVKTKLYQENPLDEEKFAVAYNDIDFCLRLYEQGYLTVFTPYAQGYHYESKSRGLDALDDNVRYQKERQNFADKWQSYFNYGDKYYNPHFTLLYENYGYK